MATCGKCKKTGQTITQVRECYGQVKTPLARPTRTYNPANALDIVAGHKAPEVQLVLTEVPFPKPAPVYAKQPDMSSIPEGKYAVVGKAGKLIYVQIKKPTKGTWKGYTFVRQLVGAPGSWAEIKHSVHTWLPWVEQILVDPMASASLYGTTFTACACCSSPLSDDVSKKRGLGPDCFKKFGV